MPFSSDKQRRWMFKFDPKMAKRWAKHSKKKLPENPESFEVNDFQMDDDPLKLREMPHLDADIDINGSHFDVVDLRIEKYPISAAEKKRLFSTFSKSGLIGNYKGEIIHFKPDYTAEIIDDPRQVRQIASLPKGWEKQAQFVKESSVPSMTEVFKRDKR